MTEETKQYIYKGLTAGKNNTELWDTFVPLDNIDSTDILCFGKKKNGTYGIGEICDITLKENDKYNTHRTGTYYKGSLRDFVVKSFAARQAVSQNKTLLKARKDSEKIGKMTVDDILSLKDWRSKEAILIYLITKLR